MIEYINQSRERYGVQKLELDILASRVANKMSSEAAENDFKGHWNLRGEKPYHRYAVAGGVDHVSENAAAIWSSSNLLNIYTTAVNSMKQAHDQFMAELPPNDGHKKTVIEKDHNYVGLGYAIIGNQFRYYEEYIDRYIGVHLEKIILNKNEETSIRFKPISNDLFPYAIFVYYEPPLIAMTREEINSKSSYTDFSSNYALQIWPWELPEKDEKGYTTVNMSFAKNGSYYVYIYLDKSPYKNNRSANTEGKIRSSGVVLFVE